MAKILFSDEWFYELSPGGAYESEFEKVVLQESEMLFPDSYMIPFKTTVFSDTDSAKPDFALIDNKYRAWWVVEVEMGVHSLTRHVIPQVETLSKASYREKEALYLCQQMPKLNCEHVVEMMKGKPPQILIIVNTPVPEWQNELKRYNTIVLFFQIFRSEKNKHIFRVNGDSPSLPEFDTTISECYCDPLIPRLLVIDTPSGLELSRAGKIKISYQNSVSEWERIDSQDKIWLSPVGFNPLAKGKNYFLVKKTDGSLVIKSDE